MKPIDPNRIKKILFISLNNIGDAILTTPCLDLIRNFFLGAEITVMVEPRAKEVFEGHPQVNHLLIYDKRAKFREKLSLILKLKEERFDLVVDLKHTIIPLLVQPRYSTPLFRKKIQGHRALQHLARLQSIGIEGPCTFILPNRDEDKKKVEALLSKREIGKEDSYVVLGPGSASSLKRWDILKFRKLGELLKEKEQPRVVIVGPKENLKELYEVFSPDQWINLAGELSLMQVGALLKRACLFITNDSDFMHLAAALCTPVLAIFGSRDPKVYGPYGTNHRVVHLDLPCPSCRKGFCRIKTHECLKILETDQVYDVARQMLSSRSCETICCKG